MEWIRGKDLQATRVQPLAGDKGSTTCRRLKRGTRPTSRRPAALPLRHGVAVPGCRDAVHTVAYAVE